MAKSIKIIKQNYFMFYLLVAALVMSVVVIITFSSNAAKRNGITAPRSSQAAKNVVSGDIDVDLKSIDKKMNVINPEDFDPELLNEETYEE